MNGGAAPSGTSSFPPQLVAKWTRTVTKADIVRAHLAKVEEGEAYPGLALTLVVAKSGAATLRGASGHWQGKLTPVGAGRIHITIPFDLPNVYRWRVSGSALTLAKVNDSDRLGVRPTWFTGVWQRK